MDLNAGSGVGQFCHELARRLFPICRSLTGPGVRETLDCIAAHLSALQVRAVASGTRAFDWIVPDEWTIREAYIEDPSGERIVDFRSHNLHVVGYSEPVDRRLELEELSEHLYSLPDQPDAIPYVTSYYARRWGFCLTHAQRQKLSRGRYRVRIDSELKPGVLNYGELLLGGQTDREVFLSTYICHPSMANNELSGPVVTIALALWLMSLKERYYTYRIAFIPETIGSTVYLSQNLKRMKRNVVAGFNVTCIGDDRCYSYLPSRAGDTLSDQAALHVLKHIDPRFNKYTWLERGSDERQYCAPGVDLPIATIMRSKYGEYPEYHTSLDDLDLVTPSGLQGGYTALRQALEVIEANVRPKVVVYCEPQLGRRGLYPSLSVKGSNAGIRNMMDMISYCDGERSILDIAEILNRPVAELVEYVGVLTEAKLLTTSRV